MIVYTDVWSKGTRCHIDLDLNLLKLFFSLSSEQPHIYNFIATSCHYSRQFAFEKQILICPSCAKCTLSFSSLSLSLPRARARRRRLFLLTLFNLLMYIRHRNVSKHRTRNLNLSLCDIFISIIEQVFNSQTKIILDIFKKRERSPLVRRDWISHLKMHADGPHEREREKF